MDTGGLIAATVMVAAIEAVVAAAEEQNDDYKDNPKTVVVAEKHVKFPPLSGFTPYYEKQAYSVTVFWISPRKGSKSAAHTDT